jgi:hypothetical protein
MDNNKGHILASAVARILRPLVRILLRNGMSYQRFAEIARSQFVDVARKEFGIAGRKQSVSRIAVITGLTRKEVTSRIRHAATEDQEKADRYHRASRVVSGWRRDEAFLDARRRPAVLPIVGPGKSFQQLVRRYGGDVPHRAVLDELRSANVVACPDKNRVKLIERAYLPRGDESMKLHILGVDTGYLIETICHNLKPEGAEPRIQRKVLYDNLPDEALPALRKLSMKSAQALLEKLDAFFSSHDRDVRPEAGGSGRNTAGVGIYYFEEPYRREDKSR